MECGILTVTADQRVNLDACCAVLMTAINITLCNRIFAVNLLNFICLRAALFNV